MEFHLSQRVQRDPRVQAWGVAPTDPYVEICWSRVAKPRAARFAYCAAKLTAHSPERFIDGSEIWDLLGEDPATVKMTDDLLVQAAIDASAHRLGRVSPSQRYFLVWDAVPLVGWQDLDRLHDVELAHHVATVHNINERVGADSPYTVALPDWVYWRAGIDDPSYADLTEVRDALFNRGLPDWPSLRIDEAGSARGLTPPAGPSGGPSAALIIPAWDGPDAGQPANPGVPPGESDVELSAGKQLSSTATGDRDEQVLAKDRGRAIGAAQHRLDASAHHSSRSSGLGL